MIYVCKSNLCYIIVFIMKLKKIESIINVELNDLRTIDCLRQSEVSVERISVSDVIEKLS